MSDIWSGALKYTGAGMAMNLINGKGLFPEDDTEAVQPINRSSSKRNRNHDDDDEETESPRPEKRRLDETGEEEPHYMKPDTDCMGNPTEGYWRQFLTTKNGDCVTGCGATKEQAHQEALKNRDERDKKDTGIQNK